MNDKARKLLKQAIKIYVKDGAGDGGYKDAIADLLHLARKDKSFLKNCSVWDGKFPQLKYLVDEGYDIYEEEGELAELNRLNRIPLKDLPLHINDEWEHESVKGEFERMLRD